MCIKGGLEMKNNLKLPIGIASFKEVVSNCYYVDKTNIIAKLCNYPKESVLLFTRPRRFGKSLTLSMIDAFFNRNETKAETYFEKTEISKDKNAMSLMSSFPVVHLDMKEVVGTTLSDMLQLLGDQIARCYHSFPELMTSDRISESDHVFIKKAEANQLDKAELILSLNRLTRAIKNHFSVCPIVLIDEYDAPLQNAYDQGFYNDAISVFKPFYSSALKGNDSLQLAILTGVMQVAKESMFSGLNNIIVNSVLDSSFDEYFGFTDKEVERLLSYYHLEEKKEEVRSWYDGYLFGKEAVYNPWSILCYVANGGEAKDYWKMTGENSLLRNVLREGNDEIKTILNSLINHESVTEFLDFSMNYSDKHYDKKTVLSILVSSGYLTVSQSLGMGLYSLRIPNKEIQSVFVNEVLSLLPNQSVLENLIFLRNAFASGNSDLIQTLFENVFLSSFSYFDFSDEKNYQILLLTLSSVLFEDAIVKSEVIQGTGRCDIQILSKKNDFGFIIEVKAYKGNVSSLRLSEYSEKALKQIIDNRYDEELKNRGVKKIIAYGFAFSKKHVKLAKKAV